MDLFLIEQMHSVFVTDAKLSSHPIVQTVSNPDEITAIFDEISYKKVLHYSIILFFEKSQVYTSHILHIFILFPRDRRLSE